MGVVKIKRTEHFNDSEFACKCCGELPVNMLYIQFVNQLEKARQIANVPFVITSGYRCEKHNKAVGGVPDSSHRSAVAADISTPNNLIRYRVLRGLFTAGFNRIGIAEDFIHVDTDVMKVSHVVWYYKPRGGSANGSSVQ